LANHFLAIESDSAVFRPTGFSFSRSNPSLAKLQEWTGAHSRLGEIKISKGAARPPSMCFSPDNVPSMSFQADN
jgi:hypothetical protein